MKDRKDYMKAGDGHQKSKSFDDKEDKSAHKGLSGHKSVNDEAERKGVAPTPKSIGPRDA